MAMITFLNGCYEAVASEEQLTSTAISEEALSKIPYQWDISDQQGISETIPPLTQELLNISISNVENNIPALTAPDIKGKKKGGVTPAIDLLETKKATDELSKDHLLSLVGVQNEEELLALPDDLFNQRVREVSSMKMSLQIISVRSDLQFEIKKAQEREAAAIRAQQREEEYARFQNRKIIGKHINSYGETIYHVVLPKKEMK